MLRIFTERVDLFVDRASAIARSATRILAGKGTQTSQTSVSCAPRGAIEAAETRVALWNHEDAARLFLRRPRAASPLLYIRRRHGRAVVVGRARRGTANARHRHRHLAIAVSPSRHSRPSFSLPTRDSSRRTPGAVASLQIPHG